MFKRRSNHVTANPKRDADSKANTDPIAIVGISARFPGSPDVASFWENIRENKDLITEVPPNRWNWEQYYGDPKKEHNKSFSKWGGFIEDMDKFDPLFFNISPREAMLMDPQQRIVMEAVYHALEDAGITIDKIKGTNTGAFIGICTHDYFVMLQNYGLLGRGQSPSGAGLPMVANRVSYWLDIHGPSEPVNTACSSSLIAIHRAVECIRNGTCEMAIAGGVNALLMPELTLAFSHAGMLSDDGKCRTFDLQANGYVRGEGVGIAILKPLSKAEQDGNPIYGIIRGTAENHGGRVKTLTTPNATAQRDLIVQAYRTAQIDPADVSCIEAHGTGTVLGDPIEIKGLKQAFEMLYHDKQRAIVSETHCAIGSVKANIGHLESAAGISGLIKVLLSIKHKTLPGNPHFNTPNKYIDLSGSPFYFQKETTAWNNANNKTRIAGVSSFGFGGANAHVIIEEYQPKVKKEYTSGSPALIVLSDLNNDRLKKQVLNVRSFLNDNLHLNIHDLAYTLQTGRTAFDERMALLIKSVPELIKSLTEYLDGQSARVVTGNIRQAEAGLSAGKDAAKDVIEKAVKNNEYTLLTKLWISGAPINWNDLYGTQRPDKISLPLYPFSRERYWADMADGGQKQAVYTSPVTTDAKTAPKITLADTGLLPVVAKNSSGDGAANKMNLVNNSQQLPAPRRDTAAVINKLTALLQQSLYLEIQVETDMKFVDYGVDSVTAVEYTKSVNEAFNINISATDLYDHPTVKHLADFVTTQQPDEQANPVIAKEIDGPVCNQPGEQPVPLQPGEQANHGYIIKGIQTPASITSDAIAISDPGPGEVQLKVLASGVNFADILCVKGLYPTMPSYPFVPGFEVSGIIVKRGAGADAFPVGTAVIALTGKQMGGHSNYVNVPWELVVQKPSRITHEEACSLPIIFITAYYALSQACLKENENILVQTAAGGCGLMSTQISRLQGAKPWGTSSKADKLAFLSAIGIEHVYNYRSADLQQSLRDQTGGKGFDVVLNMLSGDMIQTGLDLLAPGGRYIELAVHALKAGPRLDLSKLSHNQEIKTIDLRKLLLSGNMEFQKIREALQVMVGLVEQELICPVVSRIYPATAFNTALTYVETGEHIGKVVISHQASEMLDVTEVLRSRLQAQQEKAATSRPFLPTATIPPSAVKAIQKNNSTDIAIIGAAGRMPGSANLETFWEHLAAGINTVVEIPETRWDQTKYYHPDPGTDGTSYSKWMGMLEDIDKFDPLFFNISPVEASLMDPQQRLFLEESWKAIEHAGYDPLQLSNQNCGVFVGVTQGDYHSQPSAGVANYESYRLTGNSTSILSARISYLLNLKGPCMPVDTACSSSLVAMAQACDCLVMGNCDLAIAGGVSVLSTPQLHIMASKAGMLSADGQCYTFDNAANGFVPAEGAGIVVLKRLSEAEKDGDQIYGVIKGWGINHDGSTNGITAPSKDSQASLLRDIYDKFNIDPSTITYVEAHGTGTKLGDPIEVKALTEAFQTYTRQTGYCALGSVKTNIGHPLTAAAIAGVLKMLLSFKHRQIPATLNFTSLNEHINLDKSPFYVNTTLRPWDTTGNTPRRAAISSFGFSGTNAHMVLEEYGGNARKPYTSDLPAILVLSARNDDRLREQVMNLTQFLQTNADVNIYDVAYTLQVGRTAMDERIGLWVKDREAAVQQLQNYLAGQPNEVVKGNTRKEKTDFLLEGAAGKAYIESAVNNKEGRSIAQLWVKGIQIDWDLLYTGNRPDKISLPTYPFARERYWITPNEGPTGQPGILHPLLHRNESDLYDQKFVGVYTGKESFLSDHEVRGQKILPGVAYLELAREAGERSIHQKITLLKDIDWLKPLQIKESAATVYISIKASGEEVQFEVYTQNGDDKEVHSQGKLSTATVVTPAKKDIHSIRERLDQSLEGAACYSIFREAGLNYGKSFQGIEALYYAGSEALSRINVPVGPGYVLTPGVLDSALQACLGIKLAQQEAGLAVPVSVKEVSIYGEIPATGWCHARRNDNNGKLASYDIDLLNNSGEVVLSFKDLVVLPVDFTEKQTFSIAQSSFHQFKGKDTSAYDPIASGNGAIPSLAPQQGGTYVKTTDKVWVSEQLINLSADIIKLSREEFDIEEQFMDYGFDSILGNALIKKTNEFFNIDLKPTDIFNYPNIEQLSGFIVENYKDRLAIHLNASSSQEGNAGIDGRTEESTVQAPPRFTAKSEGQPNQSSRPFTSDIAIIGMSGQFASANNLEEYWDALRSGRSLIEKVPAGKWDINLADHLGNQPICEWGGFLRDVDKFDPVFFKISGSEAEVMDPQQRLFLEHCWKAIEDAAINPSTLAASRCGVYAGAARNDYLSSAIGQPASAFWGNSNSILASRISYLLDLKGPAISIDTACSSSLVAIEMGCTSLQKEDCDIVIAGGVTILSTPDFYLLATKAGMLSSDGKCYTFDSRANGFVPSEGVGVLILKRLSDAERDGDHIYGVIKGSLTNQDGATNGILAPSALSQQKLEKDVYERFNIDPVSIGYVEAHGTATQLGDPIEFEALTASFRNYTQKKQFSRLGSVKTNIGHPLAAAGVAGVIKILLSFKYKLLPPSINFKQSNPLIDLANSPFRIQTILEAWEQTDDTPRRAAISSFGFSGTNAHMVLEEYGRNVRKPYTSDLPAILVLSARNDDRLREQVMNLKQFLQTNAAVNIYDIAYTLQVGRTAMDERIALVAKDREEAAEQLQAYLEGKPGAIAKGNTRKEKSDFLLEGAAGKAYIESAVKNREGRSIARLWVKGVKIDWSLLYAGNHPGKISLPTYPFARERYWITNYQEPARQPGKLHPLLHRNESDLHEQKFVGVYTGEESFLSDHEVRGQKVLPGVAYLELAREAGERSIHRKITLLKDISWLSPVQIKDSAAEVYISVYASGEEMRFEVYTKNGDDEQLHSQGKLSTAAVTALPRKDIHSIKDRLGQSKQGAACYSIFREAGLNYGKSFQGIEALYYAGSEALSRISIPVEPGYVLTPGVLDSALQTCLGIKLAQQDAGLALPVSVKEVSIYGAIPAAGWCHARRNNGNGKVISYDIDLLNDHGEVVLSFKDFMVLPVNLFSASITSKQPAIKNEVCLFDANWKEEPASKNDGAGTSPNLSLLLANAPAGLAEKLRTHLAIEVEELHSQEEDEAFLFVFERMKAMLQARAAGKIMLVCRNEDYIRYGFISGLFKTATWEYSRVSGKIVGIEDLSVARLTDLITIIQAEQESAGVEVCYKNGKRHIQTLQPIDMPAPSSANEQVIREGGIYIITGGAGGLGLLMARHISKTINTTSILVGRTAFNEKIQASIASIPNALYHQCDISNKQQVASLIKKIKESHGRINGIIHCAGIILDHLIIQKTAEEVRKVLAVKIKGVNNLDEETKYEDLDFMVLFSSVAAVLGNIGQCDYASANAYLDNFAAYRNQLQVKGSRQGKTLSINWPLWEQGGMHIDQNQLKYLENSFGLLPMPVEEGLLTFDALLNDKKPYHQRLVTYGKADKIISTIFNTKNTVLNKTTIVSTTVDKKEIESIIIDICSTTLKLSKATFDVDVNFSEYGVDSVMMMKLLNDLESRFNISIEPAALVNYPTIELLAEYLASQQSVTPTPAIETVAKNTSQHDTNSIVQRPKRSRYTENTSASRKVAIIGMSCKLPQSDNLDAYWENLKLGRDLISEVPANRWDPAPHYSEIPAPYKTYTNKAGFINNAGQFDARYFNISDDEAISMDPQQRIILELTRALIAHAGYTKDEMAGTVTGVYIGAKDNNYVRNNYHYLPSTTLRHALVNNISNMIAARVSDFYNLKGVSQVIDTACSSSMVAIHQACEDLRHDRIGMAIAGGISIMVDPFGHVAFSQAEVLSKDGKSYVFDERASGFVLSEGAGLVLLKAYDKAVADGDQIFGVIAGSAVNNDGYTMGVTVPNKEGQMQVIQEALQKANISPQDITYYEAHGTGTLLGDPIEIKAATEVFRRYTNKTQYCALGAVKSNLGHNMNAAGITGLLKVLLQMQHHQLAPTLHCETPHPRFQFPHSPFYPNTRLKDWDAHRKIAAISSFGFGGTNCHMILEQPAPVTTGIKRASQRVERLSGNSYWLGELTPALNAIEQPVKKEAVYRYDDPYLRDHLVNGEPVLLGVTYAALMVDLLANKTQQASLNTLLFKDIVRLGQYEQTRITTTCIQGTLDAHSQKDPGSPAIQVATARFATHPAGPPPTLWPLIQEVRQGADSRFEKAIIYRSWNTKAIYQGESLRVIDEVFVKGNQSVGLMTLPQQDPAIPHYELVHPLLLNGGLLTAICTLPEADIAFVPLMIKWLTLYGKVPNHCLSVGSVVKVNREIIEVDYYLCSDAGDVLAEVKGFVCKRIRQELPLVPTAGTSGEFPSSGHINEALHSAGELLAMSAETFIRGKLAPLMSRDIAKVPSGQNFMDMGLDSSQLISLVRQLENELGEELYPTLFFEYQNIEELSKYLSVTYPDKLKTSLTSRVMVHLGTDPGDDPDLTGHRNGPSQDETGPLFLEPAVVPLSNSGDDKEEMIAIVGMHGMFPGGNDPEKFWQQLYNKSDLMEEIPSSRFDYKQWYDPTPGAKDKLYCKWGSFINDVDKFEAGFFNISGREAAMMDPQLRHLLQVLYNTIEDAGSINKIKGSNTGLYVGACFHDYHQEMASYGFPVDAHEGTGNAATMLANRPSFYFDLKGPSMFIDTACSSSLVALHTAVKAIRHKECEQALVAGVNLLLSSWHYRYFSSIGALSPTGRSHSFDNRADGYVPGESVAAVMLKSLKQAEADGDHIYAIIKGTATAHGGYTPSITAPSVDGEVNVLLKAWEDARIDPATLGYIEAHGTGTKLGDPVEIIALKKAFKKYTNDAGFCAIGSAKAHIGHTEGAAGIVGVIKLVLSMQSGIIPAMPRYESLNQYIQLKDSPFFINTDPVPWERKENLPLRGGVSSFGFGGAYAHAVIEEYRGARKVPYTSAHPAIIVLSAHNKDRLQQLIINLRDHLLAHRHLNLFDIAYTLQMARQAMEVRVAIIASNVEELITHLGIAQGEGSANIFSGSVNDTKPATHQELASLQSAIENRQPGSLARLWASGATINWAMLYESDKPARIHLPTYPFSGKRYWFTDVALPKKEVDPPVSHTGSADILRKILQSRVSDNNHTAVK